MKSRSPQTVPTDGIGLLVGKRTIHDHRHCRYGGTTSSGRPPAMCSNAKQEVGRAFSHRAAVSVTGGRRAPIHAPSPVSPRPRWKHTHATRILLGPSIAPRSPASPDWRLRISAASGDLGTTASGPAAGPASSKFPFVVNFRLVHHSIRTLESWHGDHGSLDQLGSGLGTVTRRKRGAPCRGYRST